LRPAAHTTATAVLADLDRLTGALSAAGLTDAERTVILDRARTLVAACGDSAIPTQGTGIADRLDTASHEEIVGFIAEEFGIV
jgi:pimaricinolide synthase PimS3